MEQQLDVFFRPSIGTIGETGTVDDDKAHNSTIDSRPSAVTGLYDAGTFNFWFILMCYKIDGT